MFNRGIRLPFKLLGIPLILDWSFLLILPLLAWIIGSQTGILARRFGIPQAAELQQGWMPYVLGLTAALGLFLGVVLHELGHAVTARLYGVKVRSITLWFLGGVARFDEMPRQRGAEAVVAIVGPLVSLALAGVAWGALEAIPASATEAWFVLEYLLWMNIIIAIFNMLPALPLDGGRVLRSLLALKLPYLRATQIAAGISRGFAVLIGLFGLLSFNFFLLLIAIFIFLAVSAETASGQVEQLLRDIPVRRAMNPNVRAVPADLSVADLAQRMFYERHLGFPVVDEAGRPIGMVTVDQMQGQDPKTRIDQIMSREVPTINEEEEAVKAFRLMSQDGHGRIIVVDRRGQMVGIITKTDLMRLMQLRSVSPDVLEMAEEQAPMRPFWGARPVRS